MFTIKNFGEFDVPPEDVSDGYHTVAELYDHRCMLWITVCRIQNDLNYSDYGPWHDIWRSKLHSDGSGYPGWFVLGMEKGKGEQITYHLPERFWSECEFAEDLERAPEFDGHTAAVVLERLKHV